MQYARYAVAVAVMVIGLVFVGQGLGYLPGSFMSGQQVWAVVGVIMIAIGAYLVFVTRRATPS